MNKNKRDHGKFGQLFMSLRSTLANVVSNIVPPKEIEDIVQETYVRVCQVENHAEIRCPRSFMFKVAKNLALDYVKSAEARLVSSYESCDFIDHEALQGLAGDDELTDRVASHQEFSYFCEAVRGLPLQCRKVFVLKKVYGYSQKEIATYLNLSESTVEKQVALGIKRCTKYMLALKAEPGALKGRTTNSSKQEVES